VKQYTSSANWPQADPQRVLSDAADVLADYLFTHPNPPGCGALTDAAARGSDELAIALMLWVRAIGKQP
jgi:hypothetical protein